jgi:hypothetical protein
MKVRRKYVAKIKAKPLPVKKVYETKYAATYEQIELIPNALPRMLLGKISDVINHTSGPKLKLYPPATPNTAAVELIFPIVDISFVSPISANDIDNIRRQMAIMLIPSSKRYLLP